MGEYATLRSTGADIKIGTCEDLYYLRADQARLVYGGDIASRDWSGYRFRFPFPSEDNVQPGSFEDYGKRLAIHGLMAPAELKGEHYSIQFLAQHHGYNVCLPCPESGEATHGLKVHRNGFAGATFLSQQRLIDGQLVPILECVCGLKWRVPEDESGPLFAALEAESASERHRETLSTRHWDNCELPADWRSFYDVLADRIRQGYDREYVATLGL